MLHNNISLHHHDSYLFVMPRPRLSVPLRFPKNQMLSVSKQIISLGTAPLASADLP